MVLGRGDGVVAEVLDGLSVRVWWCGEGGGDGVGERVGD